MDLHILISNVNIKYIYIYLGRPFREMVALDIFYRLFGRSAG